MPTSSLGVEAPVRRSQRRRSTVAPASPRSSEGKRSKALSRVATENSRSAHRAPIWNASARGPNDVPFPWAPGNLGCRSGPEFETVAGCGPLATAADRSPTTVRRAQSPGSAEMARTTCLHRATLRLARSARKGRAAAQSFDGTSVESHTPRPGGGAAMFFPLDEPASWRVVAMQATPCRHRATSRSTA